MTRAARFLQPLTGALVGGIGVLFVVGIFLGASSDRPEPVLSALGAPWTETGLRDAAGDVPIAWLQGYFLLLQLVPATAGITAAVLVLRGSDSWFRSYAAVALALFGTMNGAIPAVLGSEVPGALGDGLALLEGIAWAALFPLMYVFPDGSIAPRWGRWALAGWVLLLPYLGVLTLLGVEDADGVAHTVPLVLLFGSAAVAALQRYRASSPERRAQSRGVVAAVVVWFALILIYSVTPLREATRVLDGPGLALAAAASLVSYSIVGLIPASVAVGILRYRLYDVDVWVNRTFVYVVLTSAVVVVYALVTLLGTWWWRDNDLVGPTALAVLLGVGFQPLRTRVQRAVDRFVYGRRKEPYAVLSDLGRQLEAVLPADEVLGTLVRQVCIALKLPYAAATLTGSESHAEWPTGSSPSSGRRESFALCWQERQLGTLEVVTAPGDDLTPADRELLHGLARQAGVAIRAATLNTELRRSRQRILSARENERRRLQRDLHDGLGPTLASLYQRIDVARSMVTSDPEHAERLLAEVGEETRLVIGDIRALVHALRPPALELGLAAAIEAGASRLPGLRVDVNAGPRPELPPAVEAAAYRIAMEALTNAGRHASGTRATVTLTSSDDHLAVTVVDDGRGISDSAAPGTGLRSMRERADELGGACSVSVDPAGGTRVHAVLPLREGEQ